MLPDIGPAAVQIGPMLAGQHRGDIRCGERKPRRAYVHGLDAASEREPIDERAELREREPVELL